MFILYVAAPEHPGPSIPDESDRQILELGLDGNEAQGNYGSGFRARGLGLGGGRVQDMGSSLN